MEVLDKKRTLDRCFTGKGDTIASRRTDFPFCQFLHQGARTLCVDGSKLRSLVSGVSELTDRYSYRLGASQHAMEHEEGGSVADTPAVPDMRLELVPIPVSDVDRAKAFYEQVGFGNLHDTQVTEAMQVVSSLRPGRAAPSSSARGWVRLPTWSQARSKASISSRWTWLRPGPL